MPPHDGLADAPQPKEPWAACDSNVAVWSVAIAKWRPHHTPIVPQLVEEYVIGWLEEEGEESGGKKDQ